MTDLERQEVAAAAFAGPVLGRRHTQIRSAFFGGTAATAYASFARNWEAPRVSRAVYGLSGVWEPLSTRELAARAIKASDIDTLDQVSLKIAANKIVYVMRAQEKRRAICRAGIRDGASIWTKSGK